MLSAFGTLLCIPVLGLYLMIHLKEQQLKEEPEAIAQAKDNVPEANVIAQSEESSEKLKQIEASSPLEQVVLRHFAATQVDSIETLKFKAELEFERPENVTDQHEVILYFRRPNMVRRVLVQDGLRLDMGFDGVSVWAQQVAANGVSRSVDHIPEAQAAQFRDIASIGNYLWKFESEPERFSRLDDDIINNKLCYVVAYENSDIRVLTYIDSNDYLEVARREMPQGDSPATYTTVADHREIDGVILPHHFETWSRGKVYSNATIVDVEINSGVPSYLFEKPDQRYTSK